MKLVKPEAKVLPSPVLCPVDFSKPSARGLRNAVFLARSFEAQLNVLTVVPPVSTLYGRLGREKEAVQSEHGRTIISAPSKTLLVSSVFTAFPGMSWYAMGRPTVKSSRRPPMPGPISAPGTPFGGAAVDLEPDPKAARRSRMA